MLLKHQPLAVVALTTLFLLFACNGHSSPVDEDSFPDEPSVEGSAENDDEFLPGTESVENEVQPDIDYYPCAENEHQVLHQTVIIGATTSLTDYVGYTYFTGSLEFVADSMGGEKDLMLLSSLHCIGNDLNITYTKKLQSTKGLDQSLINIGGNIDIIGNESLADTDGFNNISEIKGWLDVWSNSNLSNYNGFKNVKQIGEYLNIGIQKNLINMNGFSGLEKVKSLILSSVWDLASLDGLQNLSVISLSLQILDTSIQSLYGLNNLQTIGEEVSNGAVEIASNPMLSSLEGLSIQMTKMNTSLTIANNPMLS